MRGPDADARDQTRTAPAVPDTRTFGGPPPTATFLPNAPDTRPSPQPFAHPSTPVSPPGFDMLGKIGEGGMGTVHKARDVTADRVVALKVLKLNVFDERVARERFAREVRVMARIEHPNLVPVYHSGEHNGVPYFTMKYMPGGTLAGVRGGPLSPPRVVELLRSIASGVAALHAAGVLHRDLKPSNVLLGDDGTPHVADFGLVKWVDDDDHTQTGIRNGTPQYMSPEQVAGRSRKLTAACDVWALGVIGYELACGRRPFDQDDREDLYRAITHDSPPDPYSLVPDLPPPLAQIILVCLSKDPLARYPSAAELVSDLDRFLAGQPVQATELVTITREQRVSRRGWLKAAGAVLGVGAVGGVGAYFFTRKPEPPKPEPTFQERVLAKLANGETVELIGESGLPQWHAIYPEAAVVLAADEKGGVRVTRNKNQDRPFRMAYLELFPDPLPPGYRLEADLEYLSKVEGITSVSVYVGRRNWPTEDGDWLTAVGVTQRPAEAKLRRPEQFFLEVLADPPPKLQRGDTIMPPTLFKPPGQARPDPNRFSLALTVTASGYANAAPEGVIGAKPPAPTTVADARIMLSRFVTEKPPFGRAPDVSADLPKVEADPDPLAGGLGLYLRAADVLVRSVRLVPVPT